MAAAVFVLVWPVYSGFSGDRPTHATLLQINGWWAVAPVMFPVLVSLIPLVVRRQWVRIAAIVMGGFVFISGFSIGLFYQPTGYPDAVGGVRGGFGEVAGSLVTA
jgi:hypothetical protein